MFFYRVLRQTVRPAAAVLCFILFTPASAASPSDDPAVSCDWTRRVLPASLTPLVQARPCTVHGRAGVCGLAQRTAGLVPLHDGEGAQVFSGFAGEGIDVAYDEPTHRFWVLSTAGLWVRDDGAWRAVWDPPDEVGRMHRLVVSGEEAWVATDAGVWMRRGEQDGFHPLPGPWRERKVFDLAVTNDEILILTQGGLYSIPRRSQGRDSPRAFFLFPVSQMDDSSIRAEEDAPGRRGLESAASDALQDGRTSRLFVKTDSKGRWERLAVVSGGGMYLFKRNDHRPRPYPVAGSGVASAVLDDERLILWTGSSIWIGSGRASIVWRRLFPVPPASSALMLMRDGGRLFAAGPFAIWILDQRCLLGSADFEPTTDGETGVCGSDEVPLPPLRNVQRWVVEEADVSQQKIRRWRAAARRRAWLPSLDVSVDRDTTDLWHWDSGASPDVLLKGDDTIGWRVGLSWDWGDLLFNDDVIDIETRSRLMVQLRQDLLDRAVRYYIEYKRLWAKWRAACTDPDGSSTLDDLRLSLEEMAGFLDALTGGRFSEAVSLPPSF